MNSTQLHARPVRPLRLRALWLGPVTARPAQGRRTGCFRAVLRASALALGLLGGLPALADRVHVEQAVALLRAGCAAGQANIDMQTGQDGRLYLQLNAGGQARGGTHLVHGDVERFTDITLRLQAEQSVADSGCMGQAVNRIIGTLLGLPSGVASLPPTPPAAPAAAGYVPPMMSQPAPAPAPPPAPVTAYVAPAPATVPTAGSINGRWVGLAECARNSYPVSLEVSGPSRVELRAAYSDSAHNATVDATLILVPGSSDEAARFAFRTGDDRWIVMKNGHQLSLNAAGKLVTPSDARNTCRLVLSRV